LDAAGREEDRGRAVGEDLEGVVRSSGAEPEVCFECGDGDALVLGESLGEVSCLERDAADPLQPLPFRCHAPRSALRRFGP
jgi:hypothetical protein